MSESLENSFHEIIDRHLGSTKDTTKDVAKMLCAADEEIKQLKAKALAWDRALPGINLAHKFVQASPMFNGTDAGKCVVEVLVKYAKILAEQMEERSKRLDFDAASDVMVSVESLRGMGSTTLAITIFDYLESIGVNVGYSKAAHNRKEIVRMLDTPTPVSDHFDNRKVLIASRSYEG